MVYVPSVINRFIFGHGVVIYFIMQSVLEIRSKHLPCFPSKSRQSAILFIWSRAAAILTQTNLVNSPFCRYIFIVKLNLNRLLVWYPSPSTVSGIDDGNQTNRLSVCLRDVVSK